MYISQFLLHPSYNTSEYCLHSATCGDDRVDIPSSFLRPIGVAVYGHALYPNSTYQLTVVIRDEFDQVEDGFDGFLDAAGEQFQINKRVSGSANTAYRIPQVCYYFDMRK